eukprot:TRINITY_DN2370_c0_g1_i1.p1 TRINITY_DN2370_c0_g1~~TRINITY_DN2370_c0_g1_i1.p1  ORF type:complete len:1392 (+),score=231.52 TRINITY_DN2370_c0_g1_i1:312-4178(+)
MPGFLTLVRARNFDYADCQKQLELWASTQVKGRRKKATPRAGKGSSPQKRVAEESIDCRSIHPLPSWLATQPVEQVTQRLKLVKAAWLLAGGSTQPWFNQKGTKVERWSRVRAGLKAFSDSSIDMPVGLEEAACAEDFDFDVCMVKLNRAEALAAVHASTDENLPSWFEKEPVERVTQRLKLVKAAFLLAGGPIQPWFDQNGTKVDRWSRVRMGLKAFSKSSLDMPLGLQEAACAEVFDFDGCMDKFQLDWAKAMGSIKEIAARRPVENKKTGKDETPVENKKTGKDDTGLQQSRPLRPSAQVIGVAPKVEFAHDTARPPRELLPEDAEILTPESQKPELLKAHVSSATLEEAKLAGIQARPSWEGLGVVPSDLQAGFKSLLILGPSGSGKTTLLRALLQELHPGYDGSLYPTGQWTPCCPIIEGFSTAEVGRDLLGGVGLSSVPSWCKPYEVLSVGEKYRANIAQALQHRLKAPEMPTVFDEWTSELDRGLARVVSLALRKRIQRETAGGGSSKLGPYIFATCHDDVANYLQPEFICYCQVGQAPLLMRNSFAGSQPNLRAVVRGNPCPSALHGGHDHLVGNWVLQSDGTRLSIRLRPTAEEGVFFAEFTKPLSSGQEKDKINWLREIKEKSRTSDQQGMTHEGICDPSKRHIQIGLADQDTLVVMDGPETMRFKRHCAVYAAQALMLSRDVREVQRTREVLNYKHIDTAVLQQLGWYLPPDIADDKLYDGLVRQGEPVRVSASDFCLNPSSEEVEDNPYFLATYVGEPDGSLSEKLIEVSKLLDCPFDGLCVHKIPQLPHLDKTAIGVITGPSGSGKSSLTRHMFAPCPRVEWSEAEPVLGHFACLARAREFCSAVCLDLRVAMRPYQTLSGGEQSRAHIARLLDAAAQAKENRNSNQVLVLEEFTSLVDRAVAKQMAASIQQLVIRRGLTAVFASCHSDFIGKGMVEPEWLFECHNSRLLRFVNGEQAAVQTALAPLQQELLVADKDMQQANDACNSLLSQLTSPVFTPFSESFQRTCAQLQALAQQELEAKKGHIEKLKLDIEGVRSKVLEEYRASNIANEPFTLSHQEGGTCDTDHQPQDWCDTGSQPPSLGVPLIELEVRRALPREWLHFREHHYKDHKLKGDSVAFVGLLDGRAACYTAITVEPLHFVRRGAMSGRWPADLGYPETWQSITSPRQLFREHRTVVLPDFQGMGLAPLMCDAVARYILESGNDFTSQTVHPFYGSYRNRSQFWITLPTSHTEGSAIRGNLKFSHAFKGDILPDGSRDEDRRKLLEDRVRLELS